MAQSDNGGEKTEQATPKKLEEALRRGQLPRSMEVQTVFVLLGGLLALAFVGGQTWRLLVTGTGRMLGHLHDVPLTVDVMQGYALGGTFFFLKIVGPAVLAALVGAVLAGSMQSRFNTASEALRVDWSRLNPVTGCQRIFSAENAAPSAIAIVKLAIILALLYSVIREVLADPIFYTAVSAARVAEFLADSSFKVVLRVGIAMIFIGAADYAYQFWKTNKDLMMTLQEVKDEQKNTDGNPLVKSQQRRRRWGTSFRKMLSEVPQADVIITNPTHLAIALRYDRKTMRAPKIVAKGARHNALRIRELAQQHQIPIIENKPLARLMYKHGRVGGEIPAQLYAAVAEVLAWVYRTNRYRYYVEQVELKN